MRYRKKIRYSSINTAEKAMWAVCMNTGRDESEFIIRFCNNCEKWHIRNANERGDWCGH